MPFTSSSSLDELSGQRVSSYWLALRLGEQREYVRRLLEALGRAGLVSCRSGNEGGARLERRGGVVTLETIHRATTLARPFGIDPSPRNHPGHPTRQVAAALAPVLERATRAFAQALNNVSLQDVASEARRRQAAYGAEHRRQRSAAVLPPQAGR